MSRIVSRSAWRNASDFHRPSSWISSSVNRSSRADVAAPRWKECLGYFPSRPIALIDARSWLITQFLLNEPLTSSSGAFWGRFSAVNSRRRLSTGKPSSRDTAIVIVKPWQKGRFWKRGFSSEDLGQRNRHYHELNPTKKITGLYATRSNMWICLGSLFRVWK